MPEGDTIHHAANRIRAVLEGKAPEEIRTPQPRHQRDHWPETLAGRTVCSVEAHGKHLFLRFDGGITLHSHLRMTGSWGVYRAGERWRRAARRAWIVLRYGGWEVVEFDGPVLELMSDTRTRSHPQLAGLGQDVLGERFDEGLFLRLLRADDPTRPIGDALLNQQTLAGIGNLWKAETCFAVGVDPWRPIAQVRDEEALALVGFARKAMAKSVRSGYKQRPRRVYRQAGKPCPRCGTPIRQRGQWENNRLTFWCPGCQR
ncbi:MAG TPA: DNA-formamidopyrimidine glycosylase family protein [Solirubrobacteraceae bacterium]|jgi:endonuclease-8|nr:DNA-formamidopyrimidine glycosylase family protein [Solirubrobacteraceae bacterium]